MCQMLEAEDVCEYRGSVYAIRRLVSQVFPGHFNGEAQRYWDPVTDCITPFDFDTVPTGFSMQGGRGCLGHFLLEGERLYLRAFLVHGSGGSLPVSERWVARDVSFKWDWKPGPPSFMTAKELSGLRSVEYTMKEAREVVFGKIGLARERFQSEPDFQFTCGDDLPTPRTPTWPQLRVLLKQPPLPEVISLQEGQRRAQQIAWPSRWPSAW